VALVFSQQLMGMLNKARGDVEEAMRLLQASSIGAQISASEKVKQKIENVRSELGRKIDGIKHDVASEVAALLRSEMLHRQSQGGAAALSEALVRMGVVKSEQDCLSQIEDLKNEAASLRMAKAIYDRDLLEVVKALTAPPESPGLASPSSGSTASTAVQDCVVCPISGDVMHDPVTVVESGITYDRESLCTSLLVYPDLEPFTGQRYDHPIHYTPNISIRSLLMMQYGDSYYQKYDDDDFKIQYEGKWKLLCPPLVEVDEDRISSSAAGHDAGRIITKQMLGTMMYNSVNHKGSIFSSFEGPKVHSSDGTISHSGPAASQLPHDRQDTKFRNLKDPSLFESLNFEHLSVTASGQPNTCFVPNTSFNHVDASASPSDGQAIIFEDSDEGCTIGNQISAVIDLEAQPNADKTPWASTSESAAAMAVSPTELPIEGRSGEPLQLFANVLIRWKTRFCSRRIMALIIGAAFVVVAIVVGVAVSMSAPGSNAEPPSKETATSAPTSLCNDKTNAFDQCLADSGLYGNDAQACVDCSVAYKDSLASGPSCAEITVMVCSTVHDCSSICSHCDQEALAWQTCIWDQLQPGCFAGC
jgi:hypothetical protein